MVNISDHSIQNLYRSEQLMKIDTRRSPPEPADKQPKKAERALLQVKDRAVYTIKQEKGLCNVHQTAEIFDKKGKPSYVPALTPELLDHIRTIWNELEITPYDSVSNRPRWKKSGRL
jgi:hypothetical protein